LANTLVIFNLLKWVISLLLNRYYSYSKSTFIINKTFEYGGYTQENINNNTYNSNTSIKSNADKEILIERTEKGTFKTLTTSMGLKYVTLLRYILCRKRNQIKAFYSKAKGIIYKQLSLENLLSFLIEYYRLKKYLLNEKDIEELNCVNQKILLFNFNEEKDMNMLVNFYNTD
jgi:hypothetical protein